MEQLKTVYLPLSNNRSISSAVRVLVEDSSKWAWIEEGAAIVTERFSVEASAQGKERVLLETVGPLSYA